MQCAGPGQQRSRCEEGQHSAVLQGPCCEPLGPVRGAPTPAQRQAKPVSALDVQAKAAFEVSVQSYGSRRLSAALKAQGLPVGRHKARGLMRRKFTHTTESRHSLPVAANVLARQFTP